MSNTTILVLLAVYVVGLVIIRFAWNKLIERVGWADEETNYIFGTLWAIWPLSLLVGLCVAASCAFICMSTLHEEEDETNVN